MHASFRLWRRPSPQRTALLLTAALLGLVACTAPLPPVGPAAAPVATEASAPKAAGASLRVLVFRAGAAAHLGHNHVLRADGLTVEWPTAGPVLRFRLDALAVDPPDLRAAAGSAFASAVDDGARAGTRVNLLRALEAEQHPEVVVRTLQQRGEGARRAVEVEITLHGVSRRQWLVVQVQGRRASGAAVVRQSDFGVQPFQVLGGLLAVQDALVVEFELSEPEPHELLGQPAAVR